MRHIDTQESLQDGIETGPLPAMGPDGSPLLEPARDLPPDPPRLCAYGPCRNYHTFKIQLDAQNPADVALHGRAFHTEQHHYCYPTVGVETNLGSLPVLECSRWTPPFALFRTKRGLRSDFDRELAEWREAHDPEIDDGGAESDVMLGLTVGVLVRSRGVADVVLESQQLTFRADDRIADVITEATRAIAIPADAYAGGVSESVTDADGNAYDNHEATLAQLGVGHGAKLIVVMTPKTPETNPKETV